MNALIVRQSGKPQQVFSSFLRMFLSYKYGMETTTAPDIVDATSKLRERGHDIRAVFIIQSQSITSRTTIPALGNQGQIPLFLLFPKRLADEHNQLFGGTRNVFILPWEGAFGQTEVGLKQVIANAFEQNRIGTLLGELKDVPYHVLQERVQKQVDKLDTLPTLPDIVLQILQKVNDPTTTIQDLEEILSSDPAIVWKLLNVMKSPVFSAGRRKADWTLRDVIVRLGVRKVGAIAQQIKLMNSFVKPEESGFDLRRFWEHSVASAMITENLYTQGKIKLKDKLDFNEYWIGSLLHDIGKLVLGFAFPQQFEEVMSNMNPKGDFGRDFREAEAQLGQAGLHEEIGKLVMLKVDAGEKLVEAVGAHHTGGEDGSGLAGLIHISNNLCKDLGLGYMADESGVYSETVLEQLELSQDDLKNFREDLAETITDEVKELVSRCIPADRRQGSERRRVSDGEIRLATAEPDEPESRQVAQDQLAFMLDEINQKLTSDKTLSDTDRSDLQLDVEAVRVQLVRSNPTKWPYSPCSSPWQVAPW